MHHPSSFICSTCPSPFLGRHHSREKSTPCDQRINRRRWVRYSQDDGFEVANKKNLFLNIHSRPFSKTNRNISLQPSDPIRRRVPMIHRITITFYFGSVTMPSYSLLLIYSNVRSKCRRGPSSDAVSWLVWRFE